MCIDGNLEKRKKMPSWADFLLSPGRALSSVMHIWKEVEIRHCVLLGTDPCNSMKIIKQKTINFCVVQILPALCGNFIVIFFVNQFIALQVQ